eukprot:SAG31_NODE_3020_length_4783_cov_23.090521_3_plen_341_part_00
MQEAQHASKMADVNTVLEAVDEEMNNVLRGVDSSIADTLGSIDSNRERLEQLRTRTQRGLAHADGFLEQKVGELAAAHAAEMSAVRASTAAVGLSSTAATAVLSSGGMSVPTVEELRQRHQSELAMLRRAHDALSGTTILPSDKTSTAASPATVTAASVQEQLERVGERVGALEADQRTELGKLELAHTEMLQTKLSLTLQRQSLELLHAEELARAAAGREQLQASLAAVALKLLEQTMEVDEERDEVRAIMASLGSDVFGSFETTAAYSADHDHALRALHDELEGARNGIDVLAAEVETMPWTSSSQRPALPSASETGRGVAESTSRSIFDNYDAISGN